MCPLIASRPLTFHKEAKQFRLIVRILGEIAIINVRTKWTKLIDRINASFIARCTESRHKGRIACTACNF